MHVTEPLALPPGEPTRKIPRVGIRAPLHGRMLRWAVGGVAALALVLVIAVALVIAHFLNGGNGVAAGVAQTFAAPRAGDTGKIDLTANAATVVLRPLEANNPNLLQGMYTPGKNRGDAVLEHKGDRWKLSEENGSKDAEESAQWNVGVASGVALSLSLAMDASSSDVNLQGLTLSDFSTRANAGTFRLVLPATYSGDAKGTIKADAGNVQVTVPPGAAVRIVIESKAGSRDVPSRFTARSGGYETPEYAGAKARFTLTISVNAGRVTIV